MMDELIFLSIVLVLVAGIVWLAVRIMSGKDRRKSNHAVYRRQGANKRPAHKLAGHSLVHSHSAKDLKASDEIWRSSRVKAYESQWKPGVIVANKILTDSELELEKRAPSQGHGMRSIDYSPTTFSNRSAGKKRKSS